MQHALYIPLAFYIPDCQVLRVNSQFTATVWNIVTMNTVVHESCWNLSDLSKTPTHFPLVNLNTLRLVKGIITFAINMQSLSQYSIIIMHIGQTQM